MFLLTLILLIVGTSPVSAVANDNTIIGFRWNTSDSSPRLWQIDSTGAIIANKDATFWNNNWNVTGNMRTCVVNASNATPILYGSNNRGDGLDLNGTYGDVMVEIPQFYTKSTFANGNFSYWISPIDSAGFVIAPMFYQRGNGTDVGTPAPYYYVGRYDANLVGSKLQSATGKAPAVNINITQARTYAENKGSGWGITNIWTLSGLRQLFYTEMLTLDSQTAWTGSRGIVDTTLASSSGADSIDTNTYTVNATGSGTGTDGLTPVSYRGIENLWGNVWQFQDGFTAIRGANNVSVINATGLGLTGLKTTFAIPLAANDAQSVGALVLADGYQTNLLNTDVARPLFLPSAVGGSETTYLSDYFYYPRSISAASPNILVSGGFWFSADYAGVGLLSASYAASYSNVRLGARLEARRDAAPVASFTPLGGVSGNAPLTVTFTDTSTNTPAGWAWKATNVTGNNTPFTFSTIQNPSQTFGVGNFSIALTAYNLGGSATSSQVTWVNVSFGGPVVSFTTNVTSGVNDLALYLNDTSTLSPSYWNTSWGDGDDSWTNQTSFPADNITHIYSTAGSYWINHYATNPYGTANGTPLLITVYGFANSQFSSFNTLGGVPFTTYLYDTSTNTTGGTNSWYWDLGDGNVSTAQNLYYTWNITGTYSVNRSFSNGLSTDWENKTAYVTVGTSVIAPVASFNGTPSLGANPLAEFFIDVSANTPTSWYWMFGDGSTSTDQNPQHTYTQSGFFTVNFSATNTAGTDWENKTQFVVVY